MKFTSLVRPLAQQGAKAFSEVAAKTVASRIAAPKAPEKATQILATEHFNNGVRVVSYHSQNGNVTVSGDPGHQDKMERLYKVTYTNRLDTERAEAAKDTAAPSKGNTL